MIHTTKLHQEEGFLRDFICRVKVDYYLMSNLRKFLNFSFPSYYREKEQYNLLSPVYSYTLSVGGGLYLAFVTSGKGIVIWFKSKFPESE